MVCRFFPADNLLLELRLPQAWDQISLIEILTFLSLSHTKSNPQGNFSVLSDEYIFFNISVLIKCLFQVDVFLSEEKLLCHIFIANANFLI